MLAVLFLMCTLDVEVNLIIDVELYFSKICTFRVEVNLVVHNITDDRRG